MKSLMTIAELYIIFKVLWSIRNVMKGTPKSKKTILGKVVYLASNRIHKKLDTEIRKQKGIKSGKVVNFRNYKRAGGRR